MPLVAYRRAVGLLLILLAAIVTSRTAIGQPNARNIALVATGPEATAKGYYDIQAKPGERRQLSFLVSNPSGERITGQVYATDAATADNGGIRAREPEATNVGAGAWLVRDTTLSQQLAPGEERPITFTLQVPKEARPGQHLASVIARVYTEGSDPGQVTGNTSNVKVNVVRQVIIGVLVTIPGPTERLIRTTGATLIMQGDQPWLRLKLHNDGGMIERPSLSVQLLDASERELSSQNLAMDSFYPGTEGAALLPATGLGGAGRYLIRVSAQYGENQRATGTFPVTLSAEQHEEAAAIAKEKERQQRPAGVIMLSIRAVAISGGLLVILLLGGGLLLWRLRRR